MFMDKILRLSTRLPSKGTRNVHAAFYDLNCKTLPPAQSTFRASDMIVTRSDELREPPKCAAKDYGFGKYFTDHMVTIDWSVKEGWGKPHLHKFGNLSIHPAAKALQYANQLFDGFKAHRGSDGKIRMFRPDLHMTRLRRSAVRSNLPDFDGDELISIISSLVKMDAHWTPNSEMASLYIRPSLIGTDPTLGVTGSRTAKMFIVASPVGVYFSNSEQGVTLLADPQYSRAWRGGVGGFKMGSNYGPTLHISEQAAKKGCQQVLWLSGDEQWVTEGGSMNIFVYWKNELGETELITPSLDSGTILPGITRQTVLDMTRHWGEFKVSDRDFTMDSLERAIKENRVMEIFASGTAAVITPISSLIRVKKNGDERLDVNTMKASTGLYKRIREELTDIQYGRKVVKGWSRIVV